MSILVHLDPLLGKDSLSRTSTSTVGFYMFSHLALWQVLRPEQGYAINEVGKQGALH